MALDDDDDDDGGVAVVVDDDEDGDGVGLLSSVASSSFLAVEMNDVDDGGSFQLVPVKNVDDDDDDDGDGGGGNDDDDDDDTGFKNFFDFLYLHISLSQGH